MTGYVNYFSATSLYAAWQAGIKPISPYVEAELPDGTWQTIPGEAGFPAGLERTIVVDLTGKLAGGDAQDPAGEQSRDLLGPGADRQPRRSGDAHDRSAAGAGDGAVPRLSDAD